LSKLAPQSDRKMVLVDGHAVAFTSWFQSEQNSVIPGFMKMMRDVMKKHKPAGLIVAFDPPPPTFRHELYPDYKANRPTPPDEFLDECSDLEQLLRSKGVLVCKEEGFEADDVLGTLTKQASRRGISSLVYTCDLDLLQVIDENTVVEVFSQYWPTRTFNTEAATRRFNGLKPVNIPDLKGLMGDKSDNLPGVPGIGEKSATAVLNVSDDIETLYENLDLVLDLPIRGAKRVHQLLLDHKDEAFLMKYLATIVRDVPLNIDLPLEDFPSRAFR
jgi:DNA polymerase-1